MKRGGHKNDIVQLLSMNGLDDYQQKLYERMRLNYGFF